MCSKIGRFLTTTVSKWTNKVSAYTTRRMFSLRPVNMCEMNVQTAGLHIVTPRIVTLFGDFDSKHRRTYNTATYENVRDAGSANNVWIIDVRDPREIKRTGSIHNAINIPLKHLEAALQFAPEYFFNRSGRLSKVAYKLAESMGFKNLKNFDGGYMLYEKYCDFDACFPTKHVNCVKGK